jgi:hypothetical protein
MIGHILNREPGLYVHIPPAVIKGFVVFMLTVIIFFIILIQSIRIVFNPAPPEFPMFIDGKKITFMGREPQSITEARAILSRYDHKVQDGDKVMVNE